jgi:hypothetical protein
MSDFEILRDRKQLECACKNKVFTMVVTPDIPSGAAEIIEVYCVNCQKGVVVSKGLLGISRPDPHKDASVRTDKQGRRHHSLKCDPIYIGMKPGELGGNGGK